MTEFLFEHSESKVVSDGAMMTISNADVFDRGNDLIDDRSSSHSKRYVLNAAISLGLLCLAGFLVRYPDFIDRPVAKFLNDYGTLHPFINWLMFHFDNDSLYSGVAVMAVIWWCWFEAGTASRARLLTGTLIAFPAGIVSRVLQHQISTHPRPAYDPALQFKLPDMLEDGVYNTWNSFPSDHITVFFALVVTLYIFRPRIGLFAGIYLVIIECSRLFMGAHYLTDIFGGAALAAAVVWAVQAPVILKQAERVVHYARIRPSWFYGAAFLISYQVTTLFGDIRNMAGAFHFIGLSH